MARPTSSSAEPTPPARTGRVLVVEDEPGLRSFLHETLERSGHDLASAADGEEGLALARSEPFDVVVTDLRMPRLDGMALVRKLREEQPDMEVVILTAHGDVASAVEAMKLGAFDYVEKPVKSPAVLRDLVQRALVRRGQIASVRPAGVTTDGLPTLAHAAPAMRSVVGALTRVARTQATVLLQGESGTGKEVAARAVHAMSSRARAPFIAINCAVLTENLLESELFGHERGAFTGAVAQRRGRIELADRGTFFLDEVAELRPDLQAKLLRVLELQTFERVGGTTPIRVDVRWIAASHVDLRARVKAGGFREDLYHRLAVFPVRLPPLRERREDILPLAASLLETLGRAAGRSVPPRLSREAMAYLERQTWEGNVRQLRNVLERALIITDDAVLDVHDLWVETNEPERETSREGSLSGLERRAIERALVTTKGNRRIAAEHLGISVRTLYDKMKRYGVG